MRLDYMVKLKNIKMDIFNNKRVENLELTVAQLIEVVNTQAVMIEELKNNNGGRVVFKGFQYGQDK